MKFSVLPIAAAMTFPAVVNSWLVDEVSAASNHLANVWVGSSIGMQTEHHALATMLESIRQTAMYPARALAQTHDVMAIELGGKTVLLYSNEACANVTGTLDANGQCFISPETVSLGRKDPHGRASLMCSRLRLLPSRYRTLDRGQHCCSAVCVRGSLGRCRLLSG
jgi:hypothetical protein